MRSHCFASCVVAAVLASLLPWAGAAAGDLPGPRERAARRLVEVERHAGAPVENFHFWKIDRWEGLGPLEVAVWTRINEAWLLKLRRPCAGLEFATGIGVTSTGNRVFRNFDAVVFERQRCQIAEIRPVDGKALKAERRAKSKTASR
jgi:hypothetical protein